MSKRLLILSLGIIFLWILVIAISFFLGRQGETIEAPLGIIGQTKNVETQNPKTELPVEKGKIKDKETIAEEEEVISGPLLN